MKEKEDYEVIYDAEEEVHCSWCGIEGHTYYDCKLRKQSEKELEREAERRRRKNI